MDKRARQLHRRSRSLCGASIVAVALAGASAAQTDTAPAPETEAIPSITISRDVPTDIPGGAPNTSLAAAAGFAWQEFIALNWPARQGLRDTPDPDKGAFFGQNAAAGGPPLVWQTFRNKVEIFPPRLKDGVTNPLPPPHDSNWPGPSPPPYGYDAPPDYIYVPSLRQSDVKDPYRGVGTPDGRVKACPGQAPVAQAAWVNLDEVTQILVDQIFAGVLPNEPSGINSAPQQIRFMAKANRTQYLYVLQKGYWFRSPELVAAENAFKNAIQDNQPPKEPIVFFPNGTIEVKSAWRPLAPNEDASRFHTTTVRFYENGPDTFACYREAQWALIALHIIQKTPSAPAFVFATFEQADNILDKDGKPVEDADGNIINPSPGPPTEINPTEPAQFYKDSPTDPKVFLLTGAKYCDDPGKRVFYHETVGNTGVPSEGDICVNKRFNKIPPTIIKANIAAHKVIQAYEINNKVQKSPWRYYKLVNVQAYPFDKSQIDDSEKHNRETFYQANGVVETDYTLRNFSGRLIAKPPPNSIGAATDYPEPHLDGPTAANFKNTHILTPTTIHGFNMGGCQGCHANAQYSGTDFSFLLDGNMFQVTPDRPFPLTSPLPVPKFQERFSFGE